MTQMFIIELWEILITLNSLILEAIPKERPKEKLINLNLNNSSITKIKTNKCQYLKIMLSS